MAIDTSAASPNIADSGRVSLFAQGERLALPNIADFANASYSEASDADTVPGYTLDPELSGKDSKVWTRNAEKSQGPKTVIGHRGTSLKKHGFRDMTNNLLSTMGFARFTSRHKNAEAHLARVIQKHGKDGLVATGHSAGGLVAGHLGSRYGIETHLYNPHVPLLATSNYSKPNNHIYISGKDPVSAMARFFPNSRISFVKAKGKDHHALKNFR
jgi:hypothetical protein